MWIKTVGGYLLNTDKLIFIQYDSDTGYTYGYDGEVQHIIADGDYTDIIFTAALRAAHVLEVK